jgi:hypothetical protein
MRRTILLLALASCATAALGQKNTYPGSYTDTAGITTQALIRVRLKTTGIDHITASKDGQTTDLPATAIRSFTLFEGPEEHPAGYYTYASVLLLGKSTLLRMERAGRTLILLQLGRQYVYAKNGVALVAYIRRGNIVPEMAYQALSADPVLSDMAMRNGFNIETGYESSLIFEEYDKWITAGPGQKIDTSMALKGLIDANKARLPKKLFWNNFWFARFTGIIGIAIDGDRRRTPQSKDMPIYDPHAMQDPEYARGYQLRMFTRMRDRIVTGLTVGLLTGVII